MSLPLPPKQQAQDLRLQILAAGSQWFRIHRCRHATALHWGRHDQGRWNAVDGAFGVLYVADSLEMAFAETYGHQVMDRQLPAAVKFLTREELEERCITRLTTDRDLQVLDLRGPALARQNLDARLLTTPSSCPYARPGQAGGTARLNSPMACCISRDSSPAAPIWPFTSAVWTPGRRSHWAI